MDQCQRDAKWEVKIKTFDLALVRTHAEKLILIARWTGKLEQLFKEVPNHGYFQLPYSSRGMVSGFERIPWCTEISNLAPIEGEWFS